MQFHVSRDEFHYLRDATPLPDRRMAHNKAPKYYGGSFFAVKGAKNRGILGENMDIVNIM
jgi:hypothetical protein